MPKIALDHISGDPDQPRKEFDAAELEALANSIKANGLMQAITVRPAPRKPGKYLIVAGERRYRAHCLLRERGDKVTTIEVVVKAPPSTKDLRVRQIAENVLRADLTLMEEARGYADLIALGMSAEEAAARLGVQVNRVTSRLSLLNLAPAIITLIESNQLKQADGFELAKLPNQADQLRLVLMLNRGELGKWKTLKAAVGTILAGTTQADMFGAERRASNDDVATVSAMERKIEAIANMVAAGWKDGECIVATKVSRDRAAHMADKLATIRGAVRRMEQALRNTTAQANLVLSDSDNVVSFTGAAS